MGVDLRLENSASSLPVTCLDKRFHVRVRAVGGRSAGKTPPADAIDKTTAAKMAVEALRRIVAG